MLWLSAIVLASLLAMTWWSSREGASVPASQTADALIGAIDPIRSEQDSSRFEAARREQVPSDDGQPASAPSAAAGIAVRVVGRGAMEDGIDGAIVEGPSPGPKVATDSEGRASVVVADAAAGPILLVVSAEDWATREIELPDGYDSTREVRIELVPEGAISGFARPLRGHLQGVEPLVLCWPTRRNWSASVLADSLAGRSSAHLHRVEASAVDGAFTIRGLDPSETYSLVAFARGYWPGAFPSHVPAGSIDVNCELRSLFGIRVVAEGASFTPRLLGDGPSWGSDELDDLEIEGVFLHPGEQPLFRAIYGSAALEGISPHGTGSWATSLVLYARKDGSTDPIPQLEFWVHPPGCEARQASLDLPWLGNGLGEIRLPVVPTTTCSGRLDLGRAVGNEPGWNAQTQLLLREVASDRVLRTPIDLFDPEWMILDAVPCGTYEWRIQAEYTVYAWPRPGEPLPRVAIRAGETAHAGFDDRARLGRVEIELVDQKGAPYRDTVSLELRVEHLGRTFSRNRVHIPRAPYRCGLLYAGEWTVAVDVPSPDIEVLEAAVPFRIDAGQTTNVVVPIRRR